KFLFEHERTTSTELTIETPGGIAACSLKHARGRVTEVEVDMGKAEFAASKIPVLSASEEIIDEPVQIDGTDLLVTAVSVGNPHCVVLLENLKALNLNEWGPALEHHVLFPNRTNVQFVQVIAPDRVRIVVWERGAGHTKASGSSACAVVATCVRKGLTQRKVSVEMEGGTVDIEVKDDFRILMRGPASEVYMGRISEEFIWALTHKSKVMEPTSSAFV
ncbi:MAG: diaminopimelate epimerase, partial [Chloroflexi bacterium]|nr:diaminopimelate epimerase [Chloroflexota bacterium]